MFSQREHLEKSVADLEASGTSPDNPFLQGMKAQIAMLERNKRRKETGGFWDEEGRIKMEWQNPMG